MTNLTIGPRGAALLPREVQKRYGLTPNVPIRIIETCSGILLVPQTDAPMSKELAAWQSLSAETWQMFPYEDEQ
ncbi:MAG TPA: AbrB/MazE/SpoVT family DNA-binding domain-containing protein [Chthonomonadaceae bacterium]|nr:AbrB/MazE/SpoVT family DNA-binding domain-containing protein [Chthonomonadaceae bacterium]